MKYTVQSPSNIAFIKYWGRSDHKLFIPRNNSISMNISGCMTVTTAETSAKYKEDEVYVKFYGQTEYAKLERDSIKNNDLFDQIKRIRKFSGLKEMVKIYSENNFPADAGIASSASSFAALTGVLLLVYGLKDKFEDKREYSKEVRLCGSASAVRSVGDGFVELIAGKSHGDTFAVEIADHKHWDLIDIVAIVDPEKKKISSSQGHELADTSPYFEARVKEMQGRIDIVRKAIIDKDIRKLGPEIERDSTSMHSVMMTSTPPAFYWAPGSIRIMKDVMEWREKDDLQAYFTFDAGANAHIICEKKDAKEVEKRLKAIEYVKWTIYNEPAEGAKLIDNHLF
ncbi:diphosphomevalonate decarboxylase [Candidatus Dojkabacteria bacterium]|nr:diphosphomevalonate decarboxylase [Candidatus Dojkabacteria bacterium]